MTTNGVSVLGLFCAAFVLTSAEARVSDLVGIYAIVEKVVFEPNENSAQRIQIWGAFALAAARTFDGYEQPQTGYLYYTIPPGKEDVCKKEWADLKAIAGTGEGIGFGARYNPKGRIRKAADKPVSPDAYPIGFGIVKMGRQHSQDIIAQLKDALRPQ